MHYKIILRKRNNIESCDDIVITNDIIDDLETILKTVLNDKTKPQHYSQQQVDSFMVIRNIQNIIITIAVIYSINYLSYDIFYKQIWTKTKN